MADNKSISITRFRVNKCLPFLVVSTCYFFYIRDISSILILSSQNVAGTGTDETTKACVTLHGDAPMTKKVGEKAPEDNGL